MIESAAPRNLTLVLSGCLPARSERLTCHFDEDSTEPRVRWIALEGGRVGDHERERSKRHGHWQYLERGERGHVLGTRAWKRDHQIGLGHHFINFYPPDADGNIYLPWGTAKCSFVAGSDIANVAAKALTEDGHAGKAYEITGPEAIGIADAAEVLSGVIGRKVSYVDVPESAAKTAMLGLGMPGWMVDAMMELHAIDKAGYAAAVTDTVEKVTGKKARTFSEFARENASKWR